MQGKVRPVEDFVGRVGRGGPYQNLSSSQDKLAPLRLMASDLGGQTWTRLGTKLEKLGGGHNLTAYSTTPPVPDLLTIMRGVPQGDGLPGGWGHPRFGESGSLPGVDLE
eukprot:6539136-Pyramimonas_sp.AAC.1